MGMLNNLMQCFSIFFFYFKSNFKINQTLGGTFNFNKEKIVMKFENSNTITKTPEIRICFENIVYLNML